jgi:hypothetical protein
MAITASSMLADCGGVAVVGGLADLTRRLWPVRRKIAAPLTAVVTGLAALALALTGSQTLCVVAGVLLAALLADWLMARARRTWSAVLGVGWSALRPRRKMRAPANHVYIWADGVAAAVMAAFIARQDGMACMMAAVVGLAVPFARSVWLAAS